MTLLDRYLIRQFFLNLLLVLSSLISIYLLVDFFERIDNFTEAGKSLLLAFGYFLLKIPFIYDQLSPVCLLLAGIITLGLLNKNREQMSLHAGGISAVRIIAPIIAAALLFTLLTMAAAQWVLPFANSRANEIWYREVNQQVAHGIVRKGHIFYRGEQGIYTFKRPDPQQNDFTQFIYAAFDPGRQLRLLLTAREASWSEDKGWLLKEGQLKTIRSDGSYELKLFSELPYHLPDTPLDFFVPEYHASELSLSELYQNARASLRHGDWLGTLAINQRLSFLLLGVPLLLLSVPLMQRLQRTWNRDLSLTIPLSCVLAFFAWGLWNVTQSAAQAEYVNPLIASWSIHAVLTVAGLLLLWRLNRI